MAISLRRPTSVPRKLHYIWNHNKRDVALSMPREVASGQGAILRQYELQLEQEKAEQSAQASRANSVLIGVDRQVVSLEGLVEESTSNTEAYAQLLSGSA